MTIREEIVEDLRKETPLEDAWKKVEEARTKLRNLRTELAETEARLEKASHEEERSRLRIFSLHSQPCAVLAT